MSTKLVRFGLLILSLVLAWIGLLIVLDVIYDGHVVTPWPESVIVPWPVGAICLIAGGWMWSRGGMSKSRIQDSKGECAR